MIHDHMSIKESPLIGIAGGSCSGKTTLLRELSTSLPDVIAKVSFDDFIQYIEQSRWTDIEDWDHPSLYDFHAFKQVLQDLSMGKTVQYTSYSWESYITGLRIKNVIPKQITIIEGFLIYHDEQARSLFDLKIYIDLSEEEITRRRLKRGESGVNLCDIDYITRVLLPTHRDYIVPQKNYADIVLDGLQSPDMLTNQLKEILHCNGYL